MPNCPQCGAALKDGVRFCTGCGRPVLLDTASSAPERAEPLRQSGPSNQAPSVSPPGGAVLPTAAAVHAAPAADPYRGPARLQRRRLERRRPRPRKPI